MKTRAKILSTLRSWRSSEKASRDLLGRHDRADLGVGLDGGAEVALFLPGSHRVRLHERVRLLAEHAGGREVEQQLAGEHQPVRQIQIAAHPLGIDEQLVHQPAWSCPADSRSRIVESGRITRSTEECEMSRSCQSAMSSNAACTLAATTRARPQICSQVTGFRLCGIAELPFWPAREILLGFAHFGPLQVPHFERDLLAQRRGQSASAADEGGVPVALDHLRRHRRRLQIRAARRFAPRLPVRCAPNVPTAPEILPTRRSSAAAPQARQIAAGLLVPDRELQAERDRLGVDAVRAADLHGVLELQRAALQHGAQLLADPRIRIAAACCSSSACAVSTTSFDVSP